MNRTVDVHLARGNTNVLVGRAYLATNRRGVATTFRYDHAYLADPAAFALDPALPLFAGQHAVADGLAYCFTDCAPDRWGRNLVRKRLQALDDEAGRSRRDVTQIDYLLGVTDLTRQGALRFTDPATAAPTAAATAGTGATYLAPASGVPRLLELPRLLRAAEEVEEDDGDLSAVKTLLDAGTGSLGGARPKASVRDADRLMIAKFASPRDEWDVIAWEKTVLDLAARAGIRVPTSRLRRIGTRAVLLLDRFDRSDAGRVPFVSAMTLLSARDGDDLDYVDLAEALAEHGDLTVIADLVELWRRVAFSVAVHNTDDHMRNHGFLRGRSGWALAPAFDINPHPDVGVQRQTGIGSARNRTEEIAGLMESASTFGLSARQARETLQEVFAATRSWREVAAANAIPDRELRLMADAFDGLRSAAAP